MATLVSPVLSVSDYRRKFFLLVQVPLIVIATAQDKTVPDGSCTAQYTNPDKLPEFPTESPERTITKLR